MIRSMSLVRGTVKHARCRPSILGSRSIFSASVVRPAFTTSGLAQPRRQHDGHQHRRRQYSTNFNDYVNWQTWPLYALIGSNVAICGYYLYAGPTDPRLRRWYNENLVLSNRRFQQVGTASTAWPWPGQAMGCTSFGHFHSDDVSHLHRIHGPISLQRPWTVIGYMFTQLDVLHLFANMFTLYSFGNIALGMLGPLRFSALYLASGIAGGLSQLAYNNHVRHWKQIPASYSTRYDDACIGASAAVAGVTMYYVARVPQGTTILLILPVPNWAFLPLFIGGSAYVCYSGSEKSWAHAAHLGGAATGAAYSLFRTLRRA